ncbi:MAG TPA: hypothetical protein VKE49_05420 [Myxococcaceae bacterium]|nr:hypothetical protein [Myxococcaceae bacterium]
MEQISNIAKLDQEWKGQGLSAEQRARRAWEMRRRPRLEARGMMVDPTEVETLHRRDEAKYGNPEGPTFEQLVESLSTRWSGDALYEEIIREAGRTNPETSRKFETGK